MLFIKLPVGASRTTPVTFVRMMMILLLLQCLPLLVSGWTPSMKSHTVKTTTQTPTIPAVSHHHHNHHHHRVTTLPTNIHTPMMMMMMMKKSDATEAIMTPSRIMRQLHTGALSFLLVVILASIQPPAFALADDGASSAANAKLTTGGASTLQSGRTISITRGVNLDHSNFANQNLKGVAFQQSVVRDTDFSNSNLYGASFFDATVDGSNFNGADMTLANVEMAQFNRATMKNTVAREMYVSGATLFEGLRDLEGSDWTDTFLRADQQKYLCSHPTAKGINPTTGVSTRESLMCKD